MVHIVGQGHHLCHREQTDQGGHEVDAVFQLNQTHGHAGVAADGVQTNAAQQQAQHAGEQALDEGFTGQAGDDGQAEHGQQEVFQNRELQGEGAQRGGDEQHGDGAEGAAHGGTQRGHAHGLHAAALLGQLVAVNGGGSRSGSAGRVAEDGGNGAAVNSGGVHGHQHGEGGHRAHAVGDRNEQRNAHGGGKAGQCADDHAAHSTGDQCNQHVQTEQGLKTGNQTCNINHNSSSSFPVYSSWPRTPKPSTETFSIRANTK